MGAFNFTSTGSIQPYYETPTLCVTCFQSPKPACGPNLSTGYQGWLKVGSHAGVGEMKEARPVSQVRLFPLLVLGSQGQLRCLGFLRLQFFKSSGLKLLHLGGFLPSIWYGIITKC